MRKPKVDTTALMNPQWAKFLGQTAQAQGLDASQPYNLDFAGDFGRPSINAMSYKRPKVKKFNPAMAAMDAPSTQYEF